MDLRNIGGGTTITQLSKGSFTKVWPQKKAAKRISDIFIFLSTLTLEYPESKLPLVRRGGKHIDLGFVLII